MTGNDLVSLYEFTCGAIKPNLDGISNEESLFNPQPIGNCINWVQGHVVAARGTGLTLAGAGQSGAEELVARYRMGSEPLGSADTPLDLGTLREMLDDSQQMLIPALAAMSDQALAASIPEQLRRPPLTGSVADGLVRLNSHESYHNVQLGLLRRFAGKAGAIR